MNCKPGDLAMIVRSDFEENLGGLVRVLRLDSYFEGAWMVETLSALRNALGEAIPAGSVMAAYDDRLKPIRDPGDEAVDETLTAIFLPPKEMV